MGEESAQKIQDLLDSMQTLAKTSYISYDTQMKEYFRCTTKTLIHIRGSARRSSTKSKRRTRRRNRSISSSSTKTIKTSTYTCQSENELLTHMLRQQRTVLDDLDQIQDKIDQLKDTDGTMVDLPKSAVEESAQKIQDL